MSAADSDSTKKTVHTEPSAESGHGGFFQICANLWAKYPAAVLFAIAFVCGFILIWANPMPADDTLTRYAVMADAFAEGEWNIAFHPRYGVLFTAVSGPLCACIPGLSGFRACQITALLFWSLSVFPLCGVFRILFPRGIALSGCVLYLLCSHLHRYVYDGLRDNGKTFGIALMLYGLLCFYRNRKSEPAWIAAGIGAAVLGMLRVDGFALACCLLFIFWIFDLQANRLRFSRTVCAAALFLALLMPQIILTYHWTGLPVPNSAYAYLLRDKLHLFTHQPEVQNNTVIQQEASGDE